MPANLSASVEAQLKNIARERSEAFQFVLNRFGRERLLYRLSKSEHSKRFVLKGATLFQVWADRPYRPTLDIDLLGYGTDGVEDLVSTFRDVCVVQVEDDGLVFVPGSVRGERIREAQEYEGIRLRLLARLGPAHVDLQIDIAFGDAVTPATQALTLPPLLSMAAPVLNAYPKESVVSEKFEAMVRFGIANSRMKDFYDVRFMAQAFAFDGATLSSAIRNTFERRGTPLPTGEPTAFTDEYHGDSAKRLQWRAFLRRIGEPDGADLPQVVDVIRGFLSPPSKAAADGSVLQQHWRPGGPWR